MKIYDDPARREEGGFVRALLKEDDPVTEWRVGGKLGFGGKFWRYDGKVFVTCYPEDRTPERDAIIKQTNEELARITPQEGVHGPPKYHERILMIRKAHA
jgi:hypothetical protein